MENYTELKLEGSHNRLSYTIFKTLIWGLARDLLGNIYLRSDDMLQFGDLVALVEDNSSCLFILLKVTKRKL